MEVWIVYILVAVTVLLLLAVVFKPRAGGKGEWSDHVFPHDAAFRKVGESVWCIGGQTSYGMPRNMVVYSLKHGTVRAHTAPRPPFHARVC